jgi:DNA-binding IclR family transcriptional regulator
VAAISISGPALRMDPIAENRPMIDRACETAIRISTQLGYSLHKY